MGGKGDEVWDEFNSVNSSRLETSTSTINRHFSTFTVDNRNCTLLSLLSFSTTDQLHFTQLGLDRIGSSRNVKTTVSSIFSLPLRSRKPLLHFHLICNAHTLKLSVIGVATLSTQGTFLRHYLIPFSSRVVLIDCVRECTA